MARRVCYVCVCLRLRGCRAVGASGVPCWHPTGALMYTYRLHPLERITSSCNLSHNLHFTQRCEQYVRLPRVCSPSFGVSANPWAGCLHGVKYPQSAIAAEQLQLQPGMQTVLLSSGIVN